jgi:hypothetical protein
MWVIFVKKYLARSAGAGEVCARIAHGLLGSDRATQLERAALELARSMLSTPP